MKPYKYDERYFDIISKETAINSLNSVEGFFKGGLVETSFKRKDIEAIMSRLSFVIENEKEHILNRGRGS